jgi:hypothetical protein
MSLIKVCVAFYIAINVADLEKVKFYAKQYFMEETMGAVIDEGMTFIFASIVLGILCEISTRIKRD